MGTGTERTQKEDALHSRRMAELAELLELVREQVALDGGTVELRDVDYVAGVVELELGGACGSCSLTGATLQDGITRVLTQRLDWVRAVKGTVAENDSVIGLGGWRPRNSGMD